jgi:ketosteroid isomerase-like protein
LSVAAAAAPAGSPAATQHQQQQQLQGKDVVIAFYDAYNKRDLATIQSLIADDISYHDLVYDEPHEGREGVMSWLKKVSQQASVDRTAGLIWAGRLSWQLQISGNSIFLS